MDNNPIENLLTFMAPQIGEEVHVGQWLEIDQERINAFAAITGDEQWIHVDAERAAMESLERLLNGTTLEELQQAEAVLAAAEADVQSARINLERNRLLAPVDGSVDKVLYQLGERPAPGTTVAVLLDASRVFARIYVPADLRARVRPGEMLDVRIDGVVGVRQGTVRWVSSDASFTPYFALTEHDRSRLSYLAEIDLDGMEQLPSGLPLEAAPRGSMTE